MSFLDTRTIRRDDPRLRALHEILIQAYSKEVNAMAIVGSIGILRADIAVYPKMRHTWWSILEEAAADRKLRRLVYAVLQDPEVGDVHDDVRQLLDLPLSELSASVDTGVLPRSQARRVAQRPTFGDRAALWPLGHTLTVRFLNGDPALQDRVEQAALQWVDYANLWFDFGDHADAEIRIVFDDQGIGWSYQGTQCLLIPDPKPNVCFGWLRPDSPDHHVQMAVLHEFGHVLGLQHEQGNPDSNIRWNKEAVYRKMAGPPNSWSREMTDRYFFSIWPPGYYSVYKIFDPDSIMMAAIPAEFLREGKPVEPNYDLTAVDKQFVAALYPQRGRES